MRIVVNAPAAPKPDLRLPYTVHTLLRRQDLFMGICVAKALDLAAGLSLRWVFHDDGSLKPSDFRLLESQFPGARIIERREADRFCPKVLSDFPNCSFWRGRTNLLLKLFDVPLFAEYSRVCFIDSDVLFFKYPDEVISALNNPQGVNLFNKDINTRYPFDIKKIKELTGVDVIERVNSGLWVVNKADIRLELIEKWLGHTEFGRLLKPMAENKNSPERFNIWLLDQTLLGMLTSISPYKAKHFSEPYDVAFEKRVEDSVCKHYVGYIRHGFALEGLRHLLDEQNFMHKWENFVLANKQR